MGEKKKKKNLTKKNLKNLTSISKTFKKKKTKNTNYCNRPIKKNNKLYFKDHPEFTPNLTPKDIFKLGSFGGTYFRKIRSSVTNKTYYPPKTYKEFDFLKNYKNNQIARDWNNYDININKYKVRAGTTFEDWESAGWMSSQDPYGWVQWYCRFYSGRRSPDDNRQIQRWLNYAGPNGRWRNFLIRKIYDAHKYNHKITYNSYTISPVIRQGLQHWAYYLTKSDYLNKIKNYSKTL